MKVRTINYQRTYNTGNYTSIRLGAEIELDDGDSSTEAFFKAKEIIDAEYKLLMPEPPTFGFAPSEIKVSKEEAKGEVSSLRLGFLVQSTLWAFQGRSP